MNHSVFLMEEINSLAFLGEDIGPSFFWMEEMNLIIGEYNVYMKEVEGQVNEVLS